MTEELYYNPKKNVFAVIERNPYYKAPPNYGTERMRKHRYMLNIQKDDDPYFGYKSKLKRKLSFMFVFIGEL